MSGGIDKVLAEEGVERLPGAHCYEFFAGSEQFEEMIEEEMTGAIALNVPLKVDVGVGANWMDAK